MRKKGFGGAKIQENFKKALTGTIFIDDTENSEQSIFIPVYRL